MKVIILILLIIFDSLFLDKKSKIIIVTGDITCKSCVLEIYEYFKSKKSKKNIYIGIKDKNLYSNLNTEKYYKTSIRNAQIVFLPINYQSKITKFPFLIKINNTDTTIFEYDQLYKNENLNTGLLTKLAK